MPLPKTISPVGLASLLGVSERLIRDLATEGTIVRMGRGKYDLEASVRGYCARLRETASGRGGESATQNLTAERTRLAQEQADTAALKNAQLRGELVSAVEVERQWSDVLRTVRAGLLAVPSRILQRCPHLNAQDGVEIDLEVREALKELASGV